MGCQRKKCQLKHNKYYTQLNCLRHLNAQAFSGLVSIAKKRQEDNGISGLKDVDFKTSNLDIAKRDVLWQML